MYYWGDSSYPLEGFPMVRRTKADALVTRTSLLDAAELLFQAHGVSRTSLNDIALAAGTTRGAIYWHFKDKADLFNAMMDRVVLPLEEALDSKAIPDAMDPVGDIRAAMLEALRKTANDEQTRRVFEVATHKVEYVEELIAVQQRHLSVHNQWLARTRQAMERAVTLRGEKLPLDVNTAALGLHVMVNGLIQSWFLDQQAFDLLEVGRQTIDTYLAGLGLRPKPG
jgi:TetR/AcrR family acrAB operon transcriptional repressor